MAFLVLANFGLLSIKCSIKFEYYLDGNYDEARDTRDKADEKFTFYENEMLIFEDYQQDLQNILIEFS